MCLFALLPDLVLLEIMSYLTPAENLYSFFDINDKLHCNNLLRELRYSIDICNLTTFVPSSIFCYLCANVFPHISQYVKSLVINAGFVGSRMVYEIPCILYSNLDSLYLHSLQEEDLAFVLDHAIQLKHLTLENVNPKSINMVFEKYFYRLESFFCNDILPEELTLSTSFSILSTFSVRLPRLSHLLPLIIHIPQLKNLKLDFCTWYKTDKEERLNLLQMTKSVEMKVLNNIKEFTFLSRVNNIPWSIFVRLVKSMLQLHTLFFDFGVIGAAPPDDLYRYSEINDESWNSTTPADYLSTVLQSLKQLVNLSFRLIIYSCKEKPVESRWSSPYWPRTSWFFEPRRQLCHFYTIPWPGSLKYFFELDTQLDQIISDPFVKMAYFATDSNAFNVCRFARLSRHFPMIRHLTMMDSGTIPLPPPFHGTAQTLIHCRSLRTSSSLSGSDLSQILVVLPRLRRLTVAGGLDQLAAFANFQSATVIQLNVLDWTTASIDLLSKNGFPALQFLSIELDQQTNIDEVTILQRTIEKSFDTISTLISLHYSNTMTHQDFTSIINSNRYSQFYNIHMEKRLIVVWK